MLQLFAIQVLLIYVRARSSLSIRSYCIKLQNTQSWNRLYMSSTLIGKEYTTIPLSELLSNVPVLPALRLEHKVWKNQYIGLRHGQSEANVLGIVSSNPTNGVKFHGLTELGREQSKGAARVIFEMLNPEQLPNLVWLTSPFRRAKETTDATQAELIKLLAEDGESISRAWISETKVELRERFFGEYDEKVLPFYNHVWPKDSVRFIAHYWYMFLMCFVIDKR